MINEHLFTSGNNQYNTPKYLLKYFGDFDLDLCCDPTNKVCDQGCFDMENLEIKYYGRVWCNPPYSTHLQNKAIDICIELAKAGNIVYLLIPCRMNSKRFEKLLKSKRVSEIYFPNKRISFNDLNTSAPFDVMIIELYRYISDPYITSLDIESIQKHYDDVTVK